MSDDVIIKVENLGKKYRLQHQAERQRYTALRDVIAEKAKGFFKKLKLGKQKSGNPNSNPDPISAFCSPLPALPSSEDFRALKDVSCEVRQGEVVGIIGPPREIDFHQPTHWTGKGTQFVCRAGTGERD
jgi:lipopolysaccharide transport system ATP-binding protein